MHHPVVPLILIGLLPCAYLAQRLGLLRYGAVRRALAAAAVVILLVAVWHGGVDFSMLKHMKLGLALLVAAGLLASGLRPGLGSSAGFTRFLMGTAAVSWIVYFNFFSFHGARTYIHLHDVAHYYLGSKYFPELGYDGIYIGMLRAEAELFDDHFRAIEARDLRTNGLVHIKALLVRSDAVKARFTPSRWADFQLDVAYFREAMGRQYGEVLRDHGFNPTPLWALIGGPIAALVPPGSHAGLTLLCLLDPLLLVGMFMMVGWAFGTRGALLAMIYFCILFGASFGWTGGAYLRNLWLVGLVGAVCCIERQRYAAAGGLLAWASVLRVFPAVFLYGVVCSAVAEAVRTRRLPRAYVHLFGSYVMVAVLLLAATGMLPRGFGHWREFGANIERHLANIAYNTIGLTEILVYRGPSKPANADEYAAERQRREQARRVQLFVLVPLLAGALGFALRRQPRDDVVATAMAVGLVFVGGNLAAYYYAFLVIVLLAQRRDDRLVAVMFATEAISYTVLLFEDRQVIVYFYRNLLMLYLLMAAYIEWMRRDEASILGAVPLRGDPH
jgi:hypothetical protein